MESRIRQNYNKESEAFINKQINMEMYASYVYLSMGYFFSREDQALHGFSKFFLKNSDEERGHAKMFMEYQNQRGGTIVLKDIEKPKKETWGSVLEAVEDCLDLEKTVNKALLDLHVKATEHDDAHLTDFLEGKFLDEQVKAIKELSDLVTKMKRAGHGLGEHIMDKEMADD